MLPFAPRLLSCATALLAVVNLARWVLPLKQLCFLSQLKTAIANPNS